MYYMLVRLSGCLNHIKGTIIIIIIIKLSNSYTANSNRGLSVAVSNSFESNVITIC